MEEHETEIAYWAGRLIGYDQAWEVAEEIVEAIKRAQNQALRIHDVVSWVAVKDKLPDDVTPVLVYGECCDVCWHIKIAELEQGEWWESGAGEGLVFKPTYWAKLPKPPCLYKKGN